jgi:hypothetical protein
MGDSAVKWHMFEGLIGRSPVDAGHAPMGAERGDDLAR